MGTRSDFCIKRDFAGDAFVCCKLYSISPYIFSKGIPRKRTIVAEKNVLNEKHFEWLRRLVIIFAVSRVFMIVYAESENILAM